MIKSLRSFVETEGCCPGEDSAVEWGCLRLWLGWFGCQTHPTNPPNRCSDLEQPIWIDLGCPASDRSGVGFQSMMVHNGAS